MESLPIGIKQKSKELRASQLVLVVNYPPANAGNQKRLRFNSWARKIPWRRKWQPTPVFLPAESHGQRNLAGYSPWGSKESDMTEQLLLKHPFMGHSLAVAKGLL